MSHLADLLLVLRASQDTDGNRLAYVVRTLRGDRS